MNTERYRTRPLKSSSNSFFTDSSNSSKRKPPQGWPGGLSSGTLALFNDLGFCALDEADHCFLFGGGDLEFIQRCLEMFQKRRPVIFSDAHPFVCGVHVS